MKTYNKTSDIQLYNFSHNITKIKQYTCIEYKKTVEFHIFCGHPQYLFGTHLLLSYSRSNCKDVGEITGKSGLVYNLHWE